MRCGTDSQDAAYAVVLAHRTQRALWYWLTGRSVRCGIDSQDAACAVVLAHSGIIIYSVGMVWGVIGGALWRLWPVSFGRAGLASSNHPIIGAFGSFMYHVFWWWGWGCGRARIGDRGLYRVFVLGPRVVLGPVVFLDPIFVLGRGRDGGRWRERADGLIVPQLLCGISYKITLSRSRSYLDG